MDCYHSSVDLEFELITGPSLEELDRYLSGLRQLEFALRSALSRLTSSAAPAANAWQRSLAATTFGLLDSFGGILLDSAAGKRALGKLFPVDSHFALKILKIHKVILGSLAILLSFKCLDLKALSFLTASGMRVLLTLVSSGRRTNLTNDTPIIVQTVPAEECNPIY